jgi:hypothetical protein
LLSVIPEARRQGLRLLVTPDTILRWHRDIVRCRWAARSKRWPAWESRTLISAFGRVTEPACLRILDDGQPHGGHPDCGQLILNQPERREGAPRSG